MDVEGQEAADIACMDGLVMYQGVELEWVT